MTKFPPDWAKSFLPPQPFPPIISDPALASLTASYLVVKSSVIPTAKPTLLSLWAETTTIPFFKKFLPSSTNFLKSFGDKLVTFWNLTLTLLILRSWTIFFDLSSRTLLMFNWSNCLVSSLITNFLSSEVILALPPNFLIWFEHYFNNFRFF